MDSFPIKSNQYSSTRELSNSDQTKPNHTYFISRREEVVPEKALQFSKICQNSKNEVFHKGFLQ